MPLTVPQFVAKWKAASLSERSSYQQHFLDLCALLDVTPPAEADPTGASFTFEKGVAKADGGKATQALEEAIIGSLKEMIHALTKSY